MHKSLVAEPATTAPSHDTPFVGRSVQRLEDAALVSGRGLFGDDAGVKPGTLHAAVLRSPYAHAEAVARMLAGTRC